MTKMDEFQRGKRAGLRAAIRWLHLRANEMNDPHAKALLNTAAFNLGVDRAADRINYTGQPIPFVSRPTPEHKEQR